MTAIATDGTPFEPEWLKLETAATTALKAAGIECTHGERSDLDPNNDLTFTEDVKIMNELLKVPCNILTSVPTEDRLNNFINILKEEIDEGHDIVESIRVFYTRQFASKEDRIEAHAEILAMLSDWLVDIMVFCESEMFRHGLFVEFCKRVVMQSNFTKLGDDGKPIYRADGKFLKGPGFIPPEPAMQERYNDELTLMFRNEEE